MTGSQAPEIDALLERLREEHGPDVDLAAPPTVNREGFDSAICLVDLTGTSLPDDWRQPLVVRTKADADRADEAHREMAIHRWLVDQRYPAPEMLAVFDPGELTDRPVQVMVRAPGRLLVDSFLRRPWTVRRLQRELASLQARLHALPVDGFPANDDLLDRRLRLVRVTVDRLDDEPLRAGLAGIDALADRLRAGPVAVCHGDFHPLNVLGDATTTTVIDWTDAGLGDPHGDVARTAVLFDMASIASSKPLERAVLGTIGPVLGRGYVRHYRRAATLDPERLALWRPVHLLHAWAQAGALHAGLFDHGDHGDDERTNRVPAGTADALHHRFDEALSAVPD